MTHSTLQQYDIEDEVLRRYKAGAKQAEAGLCCPVDDMDGQLLSRLPQEVIEKDYGCGDPSRYINSGDVVVDLGSGAGKICYILAQKVGAAGQVIGVDFNDEMLKVARKYRSEMAERLGYANVRFVKGKIQDLALDLERVQQLLTARPVDSVDQLHELEHECERLRGDEPMIADDSVDAVVSNCVLNLVKPADKAQLFAEIFRVLKRGGRAVISDVVCDEQPTAATVADPEMWSGCIAGAFREVQFLHMFEQAGFHGIEILSRQDKPWQVIDGVEYRSMTVRAYKGKQGPCLDRSQAVVFKGPWKQVVDDDGHTLCRGERMAVCDKTFKLYTDPAGPYAAHVDGIEPRVAVPVDDAKDFDCHRNLVRDPRETKGQDYRETQRSEGSCCDTDGNGCC